MICKSLPGSTASVKNVFLIKNTKAPFESLRCGCATRFLWFNGLSTLQNFLLSPFSPSSFLLLCLQSSITQEKRHNSDCVRRPNVCTHHIFCKFIVQNQALSFRHTFKGREHCHNTYQDSWKANINQNGTDRVAATGEGLRLSFFKILDFAYLSSDLYCVPSISE